MASGAFEPGRGRPAQAEAEARLTRLLERSLRERRAVELESLCESPGRCAWALRLDVRVLDHGGALADAVAAAALAALLAFRLPQVSREPGGSFRAHPLEEREGRPLTVHRLPVAVSFAALGSGRHLLADPSAEEEALGGARAVFSVDNARQVTAHAGGSAGFSVSQVEHLARVATGRAEEVLELVKAAAAEHSSRRVAARVRRKQDAPPQEAAGNGAGDPALSRGGALGGGESSSDSGASSSPSSSSSSSEEEAAAAETGGGPQVPLRAGAPPSSGGKGGLPRGTAAPAAAQKKRPLPVPGVCSAGLGDLPMGDPDDLAAALRPAVGSKKGRKKRGP